jgi:limonene-1,2-epoxide hydrolase
VVDAGRFGVGKLLEQVKAMSLLVRGGDPESLRRWYAPDAEVVSHDDRLIGVDAVIERLRDALAGGTFEAIRPTWYVEDDDTIAVESVVEYSVGGRLVEFPVMTMLRFDDDVVVAEHDYFDRQELRQQLGAGDH